MSVDDYKRRLAAALESVEEEQVRLVGRELRRAGAVFAAGNGGSASTADHFVCDMAKATGLRAVSLTGTALLTAVANDVGYVDAFAYQLRSLAGPADTLVVFSVSGHSPSIIRAMEDAARLGVRNVALLGRDGGRAAELADRAIVVRSDDYGIVEDVHLSIVHMLTELLRRSD